MGLGGGEDDETNSNDAPRNPRTHFVHRAFKKHHFYVGIRGSKTGQHTGEQTWGDYGFYTTQAKFPDCLALRSLCFLLDCRGRGQQRTHLWYDRLSDTSERHHAFALALK